MTSGAPIMSSQKIGPSSLDSRTRSCTGALGSSDSMLPTTGFFGGCGIGSSLLGDAIVEDSPALSQPSLRAKRSNPSLGEKKEWIASSLRCSQLRYVELPKSLPTPFDQLGADLVRLFLLRPMAAVADEVFFEIGDDLL